MKKVDESKLPIHKRPSVRKIMRETLAVMKLNGNHLFYDQNAMYSRSSMVNPCESECCFSGWIDWRFSGPKVHRLHVQQDTVQESTAAILGLETDGGIGVFDYSHHWPKQFRDEYAATEGKDRIEVLSRRVEHWFKTGE